MTRRRLKTVITKICRQKVTMPLPTLRMHCQFCKSEVEILGIADSVRILDADEQIIEALIHSGKIHSLQTVNGNFWICKDSLFQNKE